MRYILNFIFIFIYLWQPLQAQQIVRQTLSGVGSVRTAAPVRLSWTGGSCPGCSVLHPSAPTTAGYVRQGFQQPPNTENNPLNCPRNTAAFSFTRQATPSCGTNFTFDFTGTQVAGTTISWNFGEGATPRTATGAVPPTVVYATTGQKVVVLTLTNGLCKEEVAKTFFINATDIGSSVTATATNINCFGTQTGQITLTPNNNVTRTYIWSNGATSQNLTNIGAGTYTVTVVDANGCRKELTTTVTQPSTRISVTAAVVPEACVGIRNGSIRVVPTGGRAPYTYAWSNGETTAAIDSLSKATYTLSVRDSFGCRIDTSFNVVYACRDEKEGGLFDVISPNGDGANDGWIITDIDNFPKNEVYIYNRWGQMVYFKQPYSNLMPWEGQNTDGEDLPAAAYYYIIKLNDDKMTVKGGSITILR